SGTYSVNITEEGFVDTTIVINLAKDEKKIVTVELKELPPSGKVKINSDPEGATIFLQGNNTQYQTPHTFDLPIGPYLVTLKLNEFIDTAFIANSIKNNEMEYSAYLIDTLPNVNTEITHEEISSGVFQKKQINFYFNFNQNIQLDEIILYLPLSSEKHTFSFDSLQLQKGVLAQVNYPTKINGIWRFEIIGKKLGGRKENFNLNLQYTIK
ncbi:MAG: PEGA domain-containing protein, partial [Ignavibacteriae bacterium]|nr:PEGA domain-containing protein [Ignavibacteriota bacterium]